MRYLWIFLLGIFVLFSCSEKEPDKDWESDLQSIRNAHIPDQRVAVFDFQLERSGDTLLIHGSTDQTSIMKAVDSLLGERSSSPVKNQLVLLPSDTLAETWGLVHLSVANIRSRPSHSSELVTQATMGTPILLLSRDRDWYRVQTPDKYIGWLDNEGFTPRSESQMSAWRNSNRWIYRDFSGKLISTPTEDAMMIRDIILGNVLVSQNQEQNGYTHVLLPDGMKAWVPSRDILPLDSVSMHVAETKAEDVLQMATSMMGVPYLWGGTSSKAMDCSGYTKMAYWMNGFILPRDASQQVNKGMPVEMSDSLDQLQPGDLIYFGRYTEEGDQKITHVALHMGDRKIIHASGRVKVESLDPSDSLFSAYRYNTKMAIRRVLKADDEHEVVRIKDHPWYY